LNNHVNNQIMESLAWRCIQPAIIRALLRGMSQIAPGINSLRRFRIITSHSSTLGYKQCSFAITVRVAPQLIEE
jgi:hypothetical protein